MNISIVTVGSRGDIEPLVALSAALNAAGHRATLVANSEGRVSAEEARIPFVDLQFKVGDMLRSDRGASFLENGTAFGSRAVLLDAAAEGAPLLGPRIIAACRDADAILSIETVHLLAAAIAEQRRLPHIALGMVPYGATHEYPSFYADTPGLRRLPNFDTHVAVERFHHARLLPAINALRERVLGLPALGLDDAFRQREACTAVMGYSPAVFAAPRDWPAHRHVTGYWRRPDIRAPDPELARFVGDGPPPLYVGFGSMNYRPERLAPLLVDLAERTGRRIVYATGWTDSAALRGSDLPRQIFVAPEVPHGWLLPRVMGAVHHGGAGTTAAAVLAGTPSLIAWLIVDQPFWAQRMVDLGIGLDLGSFHALTGETLVRAVQSLQADAGIAARARQVQARAAAENGVARAVSIIDCYLRSATTNDLCTTEH